MPCTSAGSMSRPSKASRTMSPSEQVGLERLPERGPELSDPREQVDLERPVADGPDDLLLAAGAGRSRWTRSGRLRTSWRSRRPGRRARPAAAGTGTGRVTRPVRGLLVEGALQRDRDAAHRIHQVHQALLPDAHPVLRLDAEVLAVSTWLTSAGPAANPRWASMKSTMLIAALRRIRNIRPTGRGGIETDADLAPLS